jgi:hypothetical protein
LVLGPSDPDPICSGPPVQCVAQPCGFGQTAVCLNGTCAQTGSPPCNGLCGAGEFCCNDSCDICAPLGGTCIQIACN